MREPTDKRCGQCGEFVHGVRRNGEPAEECQCRINFADERMPDVWYFEHESFRVTAD